MFNKKSDILNELFERARKIDYKDDGSWWFSWFLYLQTRFPTLSNTQIRVLEIVFNLAYQENKGDK